MKHLKTLLVTLLTALIATTGAAAAAPAAKPHWTAVWATAMQAPNSGQPWLGPNWSRQGFANQSVRQTVRVSAGGATVRIRLSNRYGASTLRIAGASIAKNAGGAAIRPDTSRPLTFAHRPFARVPAGGELSSDPTWLPTVPLEKLTVTLYLAVPTGPATFHEYALTTTYRAAGDRRFDAGGAAFSGATSHSWYYLAGVDTAGPGRPAATVVAFGDSITDGAITGPGADNRYPDELAERWVAAGSRLAGVNLGLNGNKVRHDSDCYGEKGVTRFRRDALGQPGAGTALVLLGINDILYPYSGADPACGPPHQVTAAQLIDGHRQMIRAAHTHGVKIIGATLTPFKGSFGGTAYNEHTEGIRDALNHWIRTSGEYDAVVDLDRALADPSDPDALRPEYAAFDRLHPNDAGMAAIAAAIDARLG